MRGTAVVTAVDGERARLRAVPIESVTLHEGFWRDRFDAARTSGIPRLYERLEANGVVDNFRRRAGLDVARRGLWFTDSDLYKWMEAAAWSLASVPDAALEACLEDAVAAVLAAQDRDGYLNTNFEPDGRFPDLSWSHELYCAGHFLQAAIAHRRVTGRPQMLDAAVRLADYVCGEFGPGRRDDHDRHPGIETALVELARETGDRDYLDCARTLLDRVPHEDWSRLWGHAVCALYFAAGLADVAIESDDEGTDAQLRRFWSDLVEQSSYVTGGVGGRWVGESVGRPFELPNEGAYAETCAAVASVHWAWRMLLRTGDPKFADHLEIVLHNAFLAGVSLAGDEWFYANPSAADGQSEQDPFIGDKLPVALAGPFPLRRAPWRDVTCCPPNASRLLASLPGYLYGTDADGGLWVHLYASSTVEVAGLRVRVDTDLPWAGRVELTVEAAPARSVGLHLRVPAWAREVSVRGPRAGDHVEDHAEIGGSLDFDRVWSAGDVVLVEFGMEPEVLECNPRVAENRHSVAIRRGPLVYCVEGVDNPGFDVLDAALDVTVPLVAEHRPALLGGVTVLRGRGSVPSGSWGALYRPLSGERAVGRDVELTAIPYYAWANREVSPMTVWMRRV